LQDRDARLDVLYNLAWAYYEQRLTQEEIANSMAISRSQVSRYLSEARERGIVQIRVIHPNGRVDPLAEDLMARFPSLRSAEVLPMLTHDDAVIRSMIGLACAGFLRRSLNPGECLCIGCGRTVRGTIEGLGAYPVSNLSVVQAMGNIGHEALDIDFNALTRAAATAFTARAYYINAPAIVGSGTAAELEAANISIRESLQLARQADIYLVGLGSLDRDQLYMRAGLISPSDIAWLQNHKVAGDICGRFFDSNGEELATPFCERIVGIALQDLRRARLAIGVAGGNDKVRPLRAALRGGWLNAVITDEHTARDVIALDEDLGSLGRVVANS
jgi:deoxyribonucleoside regulator